MEQSYQMTISLNVLDHLGVNLYSNVPAVLSEIVANAWDADAKTVNICINREGGTITILDDGTGMTQEEVNHQYLVVGFQKRQQVEKESALYNRRYMGRKGIGKLSMFSIANTIDVITKKDGRIASFRLDANKIREANKTGNGVYHPEDLRVKDEPNMPDHGTKIILKNLKKNVNSQTSDYIRTRIARRFSVIDGANNFTVYVDKKPVSAKDRGYYNKLECIWYLGGDSKKYADLSPQTVVKKELSGVVCVEGQEKYKVSGWIGTVEKSSALEEEGNSLNKIVILVRGKVGQEDILSEFSEGGLYSKYLIGEIHADFFDDDEQEDMATSSRQEYRKDDPRYLLLRRYLWDRLKEIQTDWGKHKEDTGEDKAKALIPEINNWLKELKGDTRISAKKLLGKISRIITDDENRKQITKYAVLAFEKMRRFQQLRKLDLLDENNLDSLLHVMAGLDEIEAASYYEIIQNRVKTIEEFEKKLDENKRERVIQTYLFDHLWLLDPAWERVEGTEIMEKTFAKAFEADGENFSPDESKARLDMKYRLSSGKHLIIELKRPERQLSMDEVSSQVRKYYTITDKLPCISEKSEPFEIILVLGKPIDGDDSPNKRELNNKVLANYKCRIMYYDELIANARAAYGEFLSKKTESKKLLEILGSIDESAPL